MFDVLHSGELYYPLAGEITELQIQKTCQHMRIFRQHFFSPFGIYVL